MGQKRLSQEGLKIIACITMLLDHIGATLVPWIGLRIIGRLAFPIYCFLLAEGIVYTRDPKRYAIRLGIGALLAEIPFDLLFYGRFTFAHQSVMVTLLLGFLMAMWAKKRGRFWLPLAVCFLVAEFLQTDYGGTGIALVALFTFSAGHPRKHLIRVAGMAVLMLLMGSVEVTVGIVDVPIQMFALLALIPIYFYSGEKTTHSIWVQRMFYLFYPVHLAVLLMLQRV